MLVQRVLDHLWPPCFHYSEIGVLLTDLRWVPDPAQLSLFEPKQEKRYEPLAKAPSGTTLLTTMRTLTTTTGGGAGVSASKAPASVWQTRAVNRSQRFTTQ